MKKVIPVAPPAPSPLDKISMASHLLRETPPAPEVSKVRKELLSIANKLGMTPDTINCKSFDSVSDDNLAGWVRHYVSEMVAEVDRQKKFEDALETVLWRLSKYIPLPMMMRMPWK